jgi:hypothetical protein
MVLLLSSLSGCNGDASAVYSASAQITPLQQSIPYYPSLLLLLLLLVVCLIVMRTVMVLEDYTDME